MIAFPGGLQDESDTGDHVTTALRETHEEIVLIHQNHYIWSFNRFCDQK